MFALPSGRGLDTMIAATLVPMVLSCIIAGAVRGERPFAPGLTHWDAAAACGLIPALLIRAA